MLPDLMLCCVILYYIVARHRYLSLYVCTYKCVNVYVCVSFRVQILLAVAHVCVYMCCL